MGKRKVVPFRVPYKPLLYTVFSVSNSPDGQKSKSQSTFYQGTVDALCVPAEMARVGSSQETEAKPGQCRNRVDTVLHEVRDSMVTHRLITSRIRGLQHTIAMGEAMEGVRNAGLI